MVKLLSYLLIFVFFSIIFSPARSFSFPPQPHVLKSFNPKIIQAAKSCPYTVTIKTSCSSSSYTRDKISLAFGDSYGNEVYVKRLDDPSSGTFERCSTDTFQINGPCAYDICYLYLLRSGSDGWKPESVKIYGRYTKTVNFYYNTFLPNGVWYGFNLCSDKEVTGLVENLKRNQNRRPA
ncbi:embryo-specific protein ATS3A isoform X2 [Hevea brasiliensis]|uniref:embryo-specific protein ATS3A isoform X2 n=1 Tax=Hevea brasiliensis TaxID=3981 RepID=UPI0025E55EB6|nr:embryo-specific protein ATS3A isoform X2 [Hevea brasiliensis]